MRALLDRAARKDETFFTGLGFASARDFLQQARRLSALLVCPAPDGGPGQLWPHPRPPAPCRPTCAISCCAGGTRP